eukprot:7381104-Prymnesium_polylepis.1
MTSNSSGYGAPIDIQVVKHKQTSALSAHRNRHEHRPLRADAAARPHAYARRTPALALLCDHMPHPQLRNVSIVCAHAEGLAHHQDEHWWEY